MTLVNKYLGSKEFYKRTAKIAVPLSLQSLLSSTMSIVDTLMVSWIGAGFVTAVGTAAQIDTLSGMICYGAIGGCGIFSSQFFGANDHKNLKKAFGLSLCLALGNALFWFLAATFFGHFILGFYMADESVISVGLQYYDIAKWCLLLNAVSFAFSYIYRSIHRANLALVVSVISMLINISLNYVLIFGIGPFPQMGVRGAALGSVIAQGFSVLFYLLHAFKTKQPFIGSFSEMFGLHKSFVMPIIKKIMPLIVNETLFGFGATLFIKAFSKLGTASMDAYYAGNQIFNVFLFAVYGYGNAVQVLLGTILGQGKIEQAKRECNYHLGLSFVLTIILMLGMVLFAKPIVALFRLTDPFVEQTTIYIVYVLAFKLSMRLFNFVIFSILKSGGDAKIIQFLDCGLEWIVGLVCAFACVYLFNMTDIVLVLLIVQVEQLVRLVLGMQRVHKNYWAKDLTTLIQ